MNKHLLFISLLLTGSILNAQPLPVTIVFPQNGAVAVISPVNFIWNKSQLALAYTIQISKDSLFGTTVVNQSISDTTYSTSVLQMSTRYYWRVRAENISGASSWTKAMFTTKLIISQLINPADGAVDVNLTPALRWSSVFSSATYIVQLVVPFEIVVNKWIIADTTLTLDSLSRATTYYWRVKAYIVGDTTTSNLNNFTTIPFAPNTPNLLFPIDAATDIPVNVVLRWSKVENATTYKLQISTSPVFSTILKDSSFTDTLYRPKPFFNPNTQYYWRVSSTNSGGTSNYSGTYRFTTGTDTNKAKISFQNINLGIVKAGIVKDTVISITNTGNDDLIISSISNQLPSWGAVNTGLKNAEVLTLLISGTDLFAGTNGGAFLSTNNGTSWTAASTNLTNIEVRALVVSPASGGSSYKNLFAGTYGGGVFLSTNNGTSWTAASTGLTNTTILTLAISDTNLFVGTLAGGIFLSSNNGASWTASSTGLTNTTVEAFAVSGSNLLAGTFSGVFLSTNSGTSWTATGLTNSYIHALAVSGTNLFAGTDGQGVFLSTNNGTSWTAVNNGLTNTWITAFAVSGTNLFAGIYGGGVFLSTNNGTSWTAVNAGLTNAYVNRFAISGTNLFAGTLGGGVFRSDYIDLSPSISTSIISPSGAATASIHLNSMPVGSVHNKLIIVSNAPSSPDTIKVTGFGATYGMTLSSRNVNIGTVNSRQPKDTTITITNTGNVDLLINNITSDNPAFTARPSALAISAGASAKDTIRFAPTTAGSVIGKILFTSNSIPPDTITVTANGVLTDVKDIAAIPKEYSLSQNYPDPFNPSTTIQYGLPTRSSVRLVIYNILGQVVKELINTEHQAGYQSIVWNANVASGLYFYRIEATSVDDPNKRFVETKKMLLLK